ncbi:MAG TPA: GntR family transcriptional regulator, partial [Sinomonas sp.]|nr:GntR family transcriptional regulator [Sinomonas sp.]
MNLTEGVVAQLRARIVDGGLTPGEKLPSESELMEEFSVSRTVVREALSRLQAAGLVETYRGRGTFVLTIPSDEAFSVEASSVRTLAERLELLDFRLAFEVEAASLAAARRSPDELRELSQALDVFRAS